MHLKVISTLLSATLFATLSPAAAEWRGLDGSAWCSGPKLTPEKLREAIDDDKVFESLDPHMIYL